MAFRRKLTKEEKEAAEEVIATARRSARTVMRDGRQFTLVRIPDKYGRRGPSGGTGENAERLDERVDPE